MTTKAPAVGNDLKAKIKSEEQSQPAEQEKEKALSAIYAYLDEAENDRNSIAWYLHVFCRTGDGDDFGYNSSELEYAAWFCEQLLRTFLHPKASRLFCKINNQTPKYLIEYLTRLHDLFVDLRENKVAQARMDALDIKLFGSNSTAASLHNLKIIYDREREISESYQQAFDKYKGRFK